MLFDKNSFFLSLALFGLRGRKDPEGLRGEKDFVPKWLV